MNEKVLDIGCGTHKAPGAIGMDMLALPGVDVVHDISKTPWPFDDNEFSRVVSTHALQQLDNLITIMQEIHRITTVNGRVELVLPHYASDNFHTDPLSRKSIGYRTLDYFCDTELGNRYRYTNVRFEMLSRRMSFRQAPASMRQTYKFNPFRLVGIEWLVNRMPRIYERFFVYWLPVAEISFVLRVVK